MKLLEKKDYHKLLEPIKNVSINNLFALSVIEKHVTGKVFVDNCNSPKIFYVVHPYGMSLLSGDFNNSDFNGKFFEYAINKGHKRKSFEWLQASPNSWDSVLKELFEPVLIKSSDNADKIEQGVIELNTRVNFKFNQQKYTEVKLQNNFSDIEIKQTDRQLYSEMCGSVVPAAFWDCADDFMEKGIGFSLFYRGNLASTAYSAFVHDDKLEIGIETIENHRGNGFAQIVCSALIDYCLTNNLEPIWSCRLENIGSYNLAQKLGFEPTNELPFYRLSN
jgi:GNAT superfamily N-acetyltransferase